MAEHRRRRSCAPVRPQGGRRGRDHASWRPRCPWWHLGELATPALLGTVGARLRPSLSARERQPGDGPLDHSPLLKERSGVVGQFVALADVLDLRRDVRVPSAGHIRVQVMFHLVAQVAAHQVEQWSAVDIGGTDELTDVPAAASLVLHFFLAEGVCLIREVTAEDDGIRPDVTNDVGGEVRGHRRQERALDPAEPAVQQCRGATILAEPCGATQLGRQTRPLALGQPATRGQLRQRERTGADDGPAHVVLDELLACLDADALEILDEILDRLLAASDGFDVQVVQRHAPLEERHQQNVVERLGQVRGVPLLPRIDTHDLVPEILVLAANIGVSVMHIVVRVLPRVRGGGGIPVPHGRMDLRIVHPVPLTVHDVVADLHVLEDLRDPEAGGARQPGRLAGGSEQQHPSRDQQLALGCDHEVMYLRSLSPRLAYTSS